MPRGEVARQISLYADNAPPGCMGGMLHMFDWNSALLGKKLLTDSEFTDGLEAPRNSLDTISGGAGGSANTETPKSSSVKKEDIMFSYKLGNKAGTVVPPPVTRDPPRDPPRDSFSLDPNEKRRRSTSVVARLMGLDPLPDAVPSTPTLHHQQTPQTPPTTTTTTNHPKFSREKLLIAQRLLKDVKDVKDVKDLREVKAAAVPDSTTSVRELKVVPTAEQQVGRHLMRTQQRGAEIDQFSEREEDFEQITFREHPQEKQLQEFKKQFATKLAIQSHENRQRRQSESFNREVEVKRIMVQEKMNEAKAVLARGEKNDPKRLAAALDKLNKSREFQEVLEVLQSNKEFFLKFLQEPNAILFDKHLQEPLAEENMYSTPPQPVDVLKKPKPESKPKDSTEKKSKGGISPSSFARRFMESRRHHEPKQKKSSKSRTEEDTAPPSTSSSTTTISSLMPPRMRDSKAPSAERELTVRTAHEHIKQQTSSVDSYTSKKETYSPGKIVLLRPGSDQSTEISSPASVPSYSPRHFRLAKEVKDLRGYPGEQHQHHYRESRGSSREKSRHSVDCWENYASEEAARQAKESARHRAKERERSKESRDIARDIIREARAGIVRELGRGEMPSRAGEVSLTRSGSTGRRITLLRMAPDSGEVTGSSDGEGTPFSLLARDYNHHRSGSATGLSSPGSARTVRSQDSSTPFTNSKLARERAAADREKEAALLAVQLEEQQHNLQKGLSTPRKSSSSAPQDPTRSSSPRRSSSQMSSKVLRKAIVGSLLETQSLSDARQHHAAESYHKRSNEKMLLPKLLLKGERVVSNIPSEDEVSVNSPRTLQRCRSVPNAALLREKLRTELQPAETTTTSARSSSLLNHQRSHERVVVPETPPTTVVQHHTPGRQFTDSYKRGVEAVGSLFARAKSKERNKIFVRSRKKSHSDDLSSHETSQHSVATTEDVHHPYDGSDIASPLEWSGRLNLPCSNDDSEAEASEMADVKRISICSDSASYEQPAVTSLRPVVEQDLIQALSMLTPRGQVRVNVDMATDQCCTSPATEHCNSPMAADLRCRSPTTTIVTDVLEVPVVEHTPRTSKFRSIATEDSRNDEDALEACADKGGQPSPISVLDSPFEEIESPSPQDFKEVTSDLQELRLRLRLLKLDGSDRPRPSLDSTHESDVETTSSSQVAQCQEFVYREVENSAESTDELQSKPETPKLSSVVEVSHVTTEAINQDRALLESIDLEGFPYPEGRKEDLVYVRDLLVASEFVQSASKVFTRWHSPSQPLDPILFENLEDYYNGSQPQFVMKDGHIKSNPGANAEFVVKLDHRLLFDAVNDVLLKKLGPYMTFHPWVQPSKPLLLRPMPSGRQLVMETWMELCSSFPSCVSDASNSLLERDLSKSMDWMCHRENMEQIGLELERAIFNDLIDETVLSLRKLSY